MHIISSLQLHFLTPRQLPQAHILLNKQHAANMHGTCLDMHYSKVAVAHDLQCCTHIRATAVAAPLFSKAGPQPSHTRYNISHQITLANHSHTLHQNPSNSSTAAGSSLAPNQGINNSQQPVTLRSAAGITTMPIHHNIHTLQPASTMRKYAKQ